MRFCLLLFSVIYIACLSLTQQQVAPVTTIAPGPRRRRRSSKEDDDVRRHEKEDDSSRSPTAEMKDLKGAVSKLQRIVTKLHDVAKKADKKDVEVGGAKHHHSKNTGAAAASKKDDDEGEHVTVVQDVVQKVIDDPAFSFAPKDASKEDMATLLEFSSTQTTTALRHNEVGCLFSSLSNRRTDIHAYRLTN